MEATCRRRSRFRRERPPTIVPTERDVAIMHAIDQNRFLRSTHIADLYGDDSKVKLLRRLHKLYHNGYLDRPLAQLDYYQLGGGSKPLVYGITSKGSALLASKRGRGARRIENRASRVFLDHTLEIADFMVAQKLALRRIRARRPKPPPSPIR